MAAAEGMVVLEPARLGPLFGETSVLLLRDRRPDLGKVPEELAWRCDGRAGEVSREDCGEFALDGDRDTFSERAPFRLWCRCIGAVGALSDAEAEAGAGGGALFVEDSRVAVGDVWGGVVDSAWPVREWKVSSVVSGMMVNVLAVQWWAWGPGASVACWKLDDV